MHMNDILIIKKNEKFSYNRFESPEGEINQVIKTPKLDLVDYGLYQNKSRNWGVIIIDSRFEEGYLFGERMKSILTSWESCSRIIRA